MKTWRLVSGILSITFCLMVLFQSCAAGVVNSIEQNDDTSGSAGMLVGILLLAGGIVSIATRKGGKGGSIAVAVVYGLAALMGLSSAGGTYKDLIVWGVWCLVCAGLAIWAVIKGNNTQQPPNGDSSPQYDEEDDEYFE